MKGHREVPNQSHSGWHISPWHQCDRCGCDFRISDLRRQNGWLLCKDDYDNPIAWDRPMMIQDVLSNSEGEGGLSEVLTEGDNETEPQF